MTAQNFTVDNGITVNGTGGNITGATNIEASGNIVADVFSGANEYSAPIILAPSLTDYANLKYMQIRAGDDDSHIHYDSGNNAQYDLYYGDDNKYVKVGTTGNITISAYSSGSSQWVFDNTGNLTTSSNTTVTTANATGGGGGHSVTIQAGASDAAVWNSNPGGDLILKGGYGSFGDGGGGPGGNVLIYGGASSDTAPGNIVIDSGGYTWTFDNSGNLTLSDGNIIAPAIVQNGSYNTSVALSSSTGIIEANTGGNATQFLPGGAVRLSSAGTGQIISGIFDGSGLTLGSSQTDLFQNRGGNVTVKVGTGGTTTNTWTFANNGNLILPGNTFSVNYANGTPVSISGGGGTYGDSNVTTLLAALGSNTVSSTGNITTTANISGGNIKATTAVFATGNVNTGGNINSTAFTGGNIYWAANNEIRFQSAILVGTNIIKSGGGATSITLNNNGANISVLGVTSTANSTSTTTGAAIISGGAGVAGNIYAGGLIQAQQISTFGNITTNSNLTAFGNISTNGIISAAGNITGANFTSTAIISASGNVNASGGMSITGNATVSGTGGVSIPNLPAFRVYGSSSNNIPAGTITATQGATVDYNTGSHYDNTTGIFTAPVAGVYQVAGTLRVGSTNGLNQASFQKNSSGSGANVIAFWEISGNAATGHMAIGGFTKLAVSDTVRFQVLSGNVQFDPNDSWGVTFLG